MDVDQAIASVRKLADVVDPTTGERFPSSSVYQQADRVCALHMALEGIDRLKRHKDRMQSGPPKTGRPWTKDEGARMLQQFDAEVDVAALASLLCLLLSKGACRGRRASRKRRRISARSLWSWEVRDLCGKLKVKVVGGDATLVRLERVLEDGSDVPYFPGQTVEVTEPGHSGCGRHDWHSGTVRFLVAPEENRTGTVELEAELDPDPEPGSPTVKSRLTIHVVKVELVNAWETDDVCNRVPNSKQNTDNRLFVATEGSGQAEITVKASIQPTGVEDKVLCAIYDGSTHLVSDAFSAACEADLSFAPIGPAKNYAIRVGLDANGNGTLEASEFYTTVTNFNVTAFTSAHYNDQRSSLSDEMDVVKYIYPVGASLLIHFLNRTDQAYAFNATHSIGINCFTQNNLTHNAGETFAPGGNGTLDEFIWDAGSAASEKIANSDEIKGAINSVLAAHRSEVTNFFAANPTATVYEASWNQSNIATNFAETREWMRTEYDLHVAYGHATISSMTVSVVVKKDGSTIHTDNLIVTGVLTDLYDFNYEDGGRPRKAAVLQIGWDPDITGRDAGNIYFDKANFQETFDEWDFTY